MAEIRIVDLTKVFADGTVAVRDLCLTIEEREFLALLGPSGCGKTTTLRMIAGLEYPSNGQIYFGSQLMNDVAPGRRNISMVFQNYALYPHMSVAQNLEYPLKKRGVPAAERSRRVSATAHLLRIEDLLQRRPRQLSGGQQQRVALGRAIIRDPEAFLLDEPLSNLDASLRAYMRAELIELHRRLQTTMIYVTHDQMEAMTMSTRIAVLDRGSLQQIGTPHDVYNAPVNQFVASFVGTPSMNFIQGQLFTEGDRLWFRNPSLSIALDTKQLKGIPEKKDVIAGVRPEHIVVGAGLTRAHVAVVEPTGYESIVFMDVGRERLVARVPAEVPVETNVGIDIDFRPSKIHLFDSVTGRRLNG